MADISTKVLHIIAQVLHKAVDELEMDVLFADQAIDEFDVIEMIMKLEDHFGIIMQDAKVAEFSSLQDIIDHVSDLVE